MPNPSEPDRDDSAAGFDAAPDVDPGDEASPVRQSAPGEGEPATEVMAEPSQDSSPEDGTPRLNPGERRFTAPGFDAAETTVIDAAAEPATEVLRTSQEPSDSSRMSSRNAVPQMIPPRFGERLRSSNQRSWGWVLALILIILAVAAIAVLGTVLLTHGNKRRVASQQDEVRAAIQSFDIAVQKGDLAALRSMTCGNIRDGYVNYDEQAWAETYRRVSAAKQYPVVASIDQVVVNDGHAEANVTAFMAYAPQVRSTRSFDLQYRDHQWKICQSTG
ncbi:hypothetical protein [Mycobacterium sp.]|uniref:Rv0361 family membrane protein n=1 Tax=Mycobacterium sp. TaxID=1785 RepID=UPI00127C2B65|nr:hypothetical protein [Mycobacterium sp.]KAA8957736.1 MAG: hypothetical protein F6Q13_16070 [Mycobacterium sp.]